MISIRNEPRSPAFHSAKISPISAGGGPQALAQQLVGLGDQLHVGVLDAVVHHLDEVARAVGADVRAAGHAVDDGSDRLEHRAQGCVGLDRSARHDRRALQGALLAAGDPGADEVDADLAQGGLAAAGVREVRVAAVDEDVARARGAARGCRSSRRSRPPAWTIMMIRRGRSRLATKSSTDWRRDERALAAVRGHHGVGAACVRLYRATV